MFFGGQGALKWQTLNRYFITFFLSFFFYMSLGVISHLVVDHLTLVTRPLLRQLTQTGVWDVLLPVRGAEQAAAVQLQQTQERSYCLLQAASTHHSPAGTANCWLTEPLYYGKPKGPRIGDFNTWNKAIVRGFYTCNIHELSTHEISLFRVALLFFLDSVAYRGFIFVGYKNKKKIGKHRTRESFACWTVVGSPWADGKGLTLMLSRQ